MKKRYILIPIIVLFLVVILIKFKSSSTSNLLQVSTENVTTKQLVTEINSTGVVALSNSNRFYSSSSATIKEIYVEEGDYVNKGDVLFTYNENALDDLKNQLENTKLEIKANEIALNSINVEIDENSKKEYLSNINLCQSNIKSINYKIEQMNLQITQAKTESEKSKKDFENNKTLYANGGISLDLLNESENEYTKSLNNLDILTSQLNELYLSLDTEKANKELAEAKYNKYVNQNNSNEIKNKKQAQQVNLEQSKLKLKQIQNEISKFKTKEIATHSGTIINIQDSFKTGSSISEGTYLFEISDGNTVINLDVPEYEINNIKLNQTANIVCDGSETELKGIVTKIYPTSEKKIINSKEKNVVTVEVTLNEPQNLGIGFNVKGKIVTNINNNAVVIPVNAYLTDENGQDYVYTVDNKNVIHRKNIKIKSYNDMNIEIENLSVNEKVVTSPDETLLSDGITVNVVGADNNDNN